MHGGVLYCGRDAVVDDLLPAVRQHEGLDNFVNSHARLFYNAFMEEAGPRVEQLVGHMDFSTSVNQIGNDAAGRGDAADDALHVPPLKATDPMIILFSQCQFNWDPTRSF